MEYKEMYYTPYEELCKTGYQNIKTNDLDKFNIDRHFQSIINILKDGIETEEVQNMMIHVFFADNEDIELSIFDYVINLMFWQLRTSIDKPIYSVHLFFPEDITKKSIKEYIDNTFTDKYRKYLKFIDMNQIIDSVIGKFRELRSFQMYLANTLNLKDTIDLMKEYKEFDDTVHFDISGIPLEDVKDAGMKAAQTQIKYIKNSNHCLRDSFRTGEAISPKQYREVAVNIGTKPDGQGSVFPHPIMHSFMNGGLQTPEEVCVESSGGIVAQILQKTNVGESGSFARDLELNNQDTFLNPDPNYVCDTKNFEEVFIDSETKLKMYDLRYYRENPKGVDKLCDAKSCKHLIGRKLLFRSPMTCASAARGEGICYKCYGDLAYANSEVNIGQIAAEALSSIYTQILLSAKHLLESLVIKLTWVNEFYEIFDVKFNTISLKQDKIYRGWKLIIDQEIQCDEEFDETSYNYYITSFTIRKPDGTNIEIHTTESDNIYFIAEFYNYIDSIRNKNIMDDAEDDIIELDMVTLMDFPALFIMAIKNNELSRTMDQIKKIINVKSVIQSYNRNSILEAFTNTNINGGIELNAVHFEVLLMNQIRSADDELEMPDWTNPDEPYMILTLGQSLANNRSIGVRLQSNKLNKALNSPQNQVINKPSITDLYYMEQPQNYLDDETYTDSLEERRDATEPITFDDKNIKVGRY